MSESTTIPTDCPAGSAQAGRRRVFGYAVVKNGCRCQLDRQLDKAGVLVPGSTPGDYKWFDDRRVTFKPNPALP